MKQNCKNIKKCDICKDRIVKGKEAYRNGQIICQSCWFKKQQREASLIKYLWWLNNDNKRTYKR